MIQNVIDRIFSAFCIGKNIIAFFTIEDMCGRKSVTLDKLSLLLSTLGLTSLLYGCSMIGSAGGFSIESVAPISACLLILSWFGKRQFGLEKPMLELRDLKNRNFVPATVITMLFQAALLVMSVILPIYIQTILGYSATMTGFVFLSGAVFMGIMGMTSGRLFDRHGPRKPALMGGAAMGISFLGLVVLGLDSPIWLLFLIFCINGAVFALLNTPLSTWALSSLDDTQIHHGRAVLNTLRQAAGAIGTAILVTVMSIVMYTYHDPDSIPANMAGFHATALCMEATAVVLFILVFLLVKENKKTGV